MSDSRRTLDPGVLAQVWESKEPHTIEVAMRYPDGSTVYIRRRVHDDDANMCEAIAKAFLHLDRSIV